MSKITDYVIDQLNLDENDQVSLKLYPSQVQLLHKILDDVVSDSTHPYGTGGVMVVCSIIDNLNYLLRGETDEI